MGREEGLTMSGEAKRTVVWAVAEQQVKMGVSLVQARQRHRVRWARKGLKGRQIQATRGTGRLRSCLAAC